MSTAVDRRRPRAGAPDPEPWDDAPWTGWTAQVAGVVAMLGGAGAVAASLAAVSRLTRDRRR